MEGSPFPLLRRQDAARPCNFARLPDDCVGHLLQLIDVAGVPCFRAVCRAFQAAARARAGEQVLPARVIHSGPSVAAWAWAQPAFRTAAGEGVAFACAQIGNLDMLERVLDHRNDFKVYDYNLWIGAGEAGHTHVLQWLLGQAAMLSTGNATELDLFDCSIGDEGMLYLASALRADTTLASLNVLRNKLTEAADAMLLAFELRVNATVSQLDLRYNDIGAIGAQHIAEALKLNATVTQLVLFDNFIGAIGAQHIAEALKVNATVIQLDLRSNDIGAIGAQHIVMALKVNATVTQLDLGDNHIGAVGAQDIAEALKVNATITQLDLGNNNFDDYMEGESAAPGSEEVVAAAALAVGSAPAVRSAPATESAPAVERAPAAAVAAPAPAASSPAAEDAADGGLHWDARHCFNAEGVYCYCGEGRSLGEVALQCCGCRQWFHARCVSAKCVSSMVPMQRNYTFVCRVCTGSVPGTVAGFERFDLLENNWRSIVECAILNLSLDEQGVLRLEGGGARTPR
ncbi:hypothetical protein T492DRAFT_868687, partial [Pavlovales sp. CCMP2436]